MSITLRLGVSTLALAILSPSQVLAQSSTANSATDVGDETQDITVTARRITERLADVPVAVSVVSGDRLTVSNYTRVEDLNLIAPSTNVVVSNGRQTSFSLRGLGNNPGNDGLEASAGVFVDGVYLGRPGMAVFDLMDINQIEVLRGPQGTLFGKNTTAGAINITTKLPEFDFGAQARGSYGNYDFQQYQATITGPVISDVLAARLTGYVTRSDGNVRNLTMGKKVNMRAREGIRGQLLFTPTPDLKLRIIGEYHHEDQDTGTILRLTNLGATPNLLQTKLNALGVTLIADPSGEISYAGTPGSQIMKQAAVSAQADWSFGQGFELTSITAWRNWNYRSSADSDLTAADAIVGAQAPVRSEQFSQEVRLRAPRVGPVDIIGGLYYFHQSVFADGRTKYGSDAAAWLSGVSPSNLPAAAASSPAVAALLNYNNTQWDVIATPKTDSYAAFAQAVIHLSSRWNVTGGLRATHEKKTARIYRPQPISSITGQPVAGLASQAYAPFSLSTDDTGVSYLISTDYHVAPDVLLYGSISRGQKAGGVNPALPPSGAVDRLLVRPETATAYEIGLKSSFFDRLLTANLAFFRTDVRDYQSTAQNFVNGAFISLLSNVGRVRSEGVEVETTLRPVRGLTLNAAVSYNDARYRSFPNAPCPAGTTAPSCDLTGQKLAGAPPWIVNLSGQYETRVTDAASAFFGADYSRRSSFSGYVDNSPYARISTFGILNLRAGVRFSDDRYDVTVWGRNVTDTRYAPGYISLGGSAPGVYAATVFGDPATYGVSFQAKF